MPTGNDFSYLIPLCGTKLCTIGVLVRYFYSPKNVVQTSKALYLPPTPVTWNLQSQHHQSAAATLKRPSPAVKVTIARSQSGRCLPLRKRPFLVFASAFARHCSLRQLLLPAVAVTVSAEASPAIACCRKCCHPPSQLPLTAVVVAAACHCSGRCPPCLSCCQPLHPHLPSLRVALSLLLLLVSVVCPSRSLCCQPPTCIALPPPPCMASCC